MKETQNSDKSTSNSRSGQTTPTSQTLLSETLKTQAVESPNYIAEFTRGYELGWAVARAHNENEIVMPEQAPRLPWQNPSN